MVVSDKLGCVFVHVQKTGGSSIETALRAADPLGASRIEKGGRHRTASEIREGMDPAQWQRSFRFGFVRNPWDRLVSWYAMCVQATAPNAFARHVIEHVPSFESFIEQPVGMLERTARPQCDYLEDAQGLRLVDFVGRYEALAADFATVAQRLLIDAALPHDNPSRHRPYRDYFNTRTRKLVEQRFARDLDAFGYTF